MIDHVTPEHEAVASRLWCEHCDVQGYPNGMPTWTEMRASKHPEWKWTREEFLTLARGAIEAVDNFRKLHNGGGEVAHG